MKKPPDGIYSDELLEGFAESSLATSGARPDANIFHWYENNFPQCLEGYHIIDWGAGSARFLTTYLSKRPSHITLVEPNESALSSLPSKVGEVNIEVVKARLGIGVRRRVSSSNTINTINFVLNCFADLADGFRQLRSSVKAGEQIIIFSTILLPPELYAQVNEQGMFATYPFDLRWGAQTQSSRPSAPTFQIRIENSDVLLTDALHTIEDYRDALEQSGPWRTEAVSLLKPCGFQLVTAEPSGLCNYGLAVILLELRLVE